MIRLPLTRVALAAGLLWATAQVAAAQAGPSRRRPRRSTN